ncbi:MAG: hypothetical protein WC055_12015 [Melioribacteraceae bacterium]
MGKRLTIPSEVLALNPDFNIHEIRAMIGVIWKNKNNRLRQSHIFKVKLPAIGTLKSRGNKRPKRRQSVLKKDRERKRLLKSSKNLPVND